MLWVRFSTPLATMKHLINKSVQFLGIFLLCAVVSLIADVILSGFLSILFQTPFYQIFTSNAMEGTTLVLWMMCLIACFTYTPNK
jgi:hypothetical protein